MHILKFPRGRMTSGKVCIFKFKRQSSLSIEDGWFRDPLWISNSMDAQVHYRKWCSIVRPLYPWFPRPWIGRAAIGLNEFPKHLYWCIFTLVFLLFYNVPLYCQTSFYIYFCKSDCVKWFLSVIFIHIFPCHRLSVLSKVCAICFLPLWIA